MRPGKNGHPMAPMAAATLGKSLFVRLINHWHYDPLESDVRANHQKHRRLPLERGWLLLRARQVTVSDKQLKTVRNNEASSRF